jgi:tripartite ATP-independent transporter DctM subunit
MSPELIGVIGVVVMLALVFLRMWIGLALALIGFLGCVWLVGIDRAFLVVATVPLKYVAVYTFSAVPLFLLMGTVLYHTGIAKDLFYSAYKWVGQLKGGLAMASALAAAILGVVTDSLVAIVTLGKAAVPEMKKYDYDETMATSSIVAGASLASLIPPSVGFILYAMLTENPVGQLFIAAVIPGIVLTILILAVIVIWVSINPRVAPAGPKTSFKEKILSLKFTWATMLLIVLIIAGIYGGVFTPTEAGGVGAFVAFIIAIASRRLTFKNFFDSLKETAETTAMIVILLVGAFTFMKFLALSKMTFWLGDIIGGLDVSRYIILAIIMLVYLIFGMFTEIVSSIILTMPIMYPIVVHTLGFDPIWYGVVIIMVIELGFMTPPIGMNVFVLSGVTGVPAGTIFRGVWQFVVAIAVWIVILTIFPQIATYLPSTM